MDITTIAFVVDAEEKTSASWEIGEAASIWPPAECTSDRHTDSQHERPRFKAFPHCRRKVRLSPNSANVAVLLPFSATVALFCDSVDRALQRCIVRWITENDFF